MKNKNKKNVLGAKILLVLLAAAISIAITSKSATAKSLYVIADILGASESGTQPVQAYDIGVDGTLTFQAQYSIPYTMLGAADMAIDSDSGYVFITYEASSDIQLIEAKTMTDAGRVRAPDATDLAGIVYDHEKGLLYCVDRGKAYLYVYNWNPDTVTLTHVPGSPFTLQNATAYGIAMDETDDLLYVTNANNTVTVYSTSDWSLVETITLSRIAISIAVDDKNGFIYTGGGYAGNMFLTQYHLATGTEKEVQVEPDAGVMGLGVDPDTGIVYMSTGRDTAPGGDNLLVYDQALNQIDFIAAIGNPTGLTIPDKDIGFNPLNLNKEVIRGANTGADYDYMKTVEPGSTYTYGISFQNNNDFSVTDVTIVDTLPDGVVFVTATDDEVNGHYEYNEQTRTQTFTWTYQELPPGTSTLLELTVNVNPDSDADTIVTNSVTISSNETPPTTTSADVIVTSNDLNLKKDILGIPEGQTAQVNTNDIITYIIEFDNKDNDFPVSNVTAVDELPRNVTFISADDSNGIGRYDNKTHTYTWAFDSLVPGEVVHLELVVLVNPNLAVGTMITNFVTIDSNETPPSSAIAEAVTYYKPLNIVKKAVDMSGSELKWVNPGDRFTYQICFDNNNNDSMVTEVSIIDQLPDELTFVMADNGKASGKYDAMAHTYTWSYGPLNPGITDCIELVVDVKENTPFDTMITNIVTIDSNETLPATAIINLSVGEAHLEADNLEVSTSTISRDDPGGDITFTIELPESIGIDDVLDEPLILYPANIEAFDQQITEIDGKVKIIAVFDKDELLNAIPDYNGPLDITVEGILTSDQIFFGEATITVTQAGSALPSVKVENIEVSVSTISLDDAIEDIRFIIELPEGIGIDDVADEFLLLYPPNIDAFDQDIIEQDGRVKITAIFDKYELLRAMPDYYGPLDLTVEGVLKSGQIFSGEATITIIQAEDISDYISNIYIEQIWNYGDPNDNTDLIYEFYLNIYSYSDMAKNINTNVDSVEFLTPAGNTFQIPKLPGKWSDEIWTSYEYDPNKYETTWEYNVKYSELTDFEAYGDGEYTIILNHTDGSKSQTTVWFGIPDTNDPIPQPTQEPVFTFPLHNQKAKSPVTFTWEPCTDPNTEYIFINVDALGTVWLGDKGGDFETTQTSWGPVYLQDGFWDAELIFHPGPWWGIWSDINSDEIQVAVTKYSRSRYRFTVEGSPWTKYEVWGGNTWTEDLGNISALDALGYIKLGESDGPTETFSGQYQYYLIATVGEFLLDSIQGSDGLYYPSFEPNDIIFQTYNSNNFLGPPDGKCAIVGVNNALDDYSGYFVITNPGNWEGLTIITSDLNLNLSNSILDDAKEIENINPNDTITYRICFDSNDFTQDVTDVTVVDILPDEVTFLSADSNDVSGTYDSDKHTYTCSYPSLAPATKIEIQLTVQVNPDVVPGATITNFATINSNQTPPSTASIDTVVYYEPLNLTKTAINDSSNRKEIEWIEPGKSFIYQICFDNNKNSSPVTGVFLIDTLPSEVNFVEANVDNNDFIGDYNSGKHSYIGALSSLDPNVVICLEITVEVKQETLPGTIFTNSVTIESTETQMQTASVNVEVNEPVIEIPDGNEPIIEVLPPKNVDLSIIPNVLRHNGTSQYITAVVQFPEGTNQNDIDLNDQPELCYQDRSTGEFIFIEKGSAPVLSGTADRPQISISFNRAELMKALYGYGEFKLRVQGKLTTGQYNGEAIIYVTRFVGE